MLHMDPVWSLETSGQFLLQVCVRVCTRAVLSERLCVDGMQKLLMVLILLVPLREETSAQVLWSTSSGVLRLC